MSRYSGDSYGELPDIFWQIDLERALKSGRGQRILHEIEHALRSLPERKLIEDAIVQWDDEERVGQVCAVGAYAAFKRVQAGASWDEAFETLSEEHSGWADEWQTQALGQSVGMARTVAWELGRINDEDFGHLKPRQRWRAVLKWVRSEIKKEVAA